MPVIVIGATILTLTGGTAMRARTQTLAGIRSASEERARGLASACAEIAIGKLQTMFGYAGNETVSAAGITCEILSITGEGNYNRVITARGTTGVSVKTVQVTVTQISSPTKISSWKEIIN